DDATGKRKKITSCCKECKMNAPKLREQRTQEISKVIIAYQQVGEDRTLQLEKKNGKEQKQLDDLKKD
ncbi:5358_t:CDS:2, partial [Gigaspora margarita]